MFPDYAVQWVLDNIGLGDRRRSRALAEIALGLIAAGRVSMAMIARAIAGDATPASNHKRIQRFCDSEHINPEDVQRALFRELIGQHISRKGWFGSQPVILSIDWHRYDNGEISGLRVSLVTGSRALPLLWYEVPFKDLKGWQTEIERKAVETITKLRPPNVTWVLLLDCGFHAPEVLDALNEAGYFIVRSQIHPLVHSGAGCWRAVADLPVELGDLLECGWVTWSSSSPRSVRMVAAWMPRVKQRNRRTSPHPCRHKKPGYCPLITNLPESEFDAEAVLRLYARRFEIEHSFRDIKSATLGMDMEHVHLKKIERYSRLMCVVAVAEALSWLCGAEAERRGLAKLYTSSRPKDGRRVLSLVRLGKYAMAHIDTPVPSLIRRHLAPAIRNAGEVTGATWRRPSRHYRLADLAPCPEEAPRPPRPCRRRRKGDVIPFKPCDVSPAWERVLTQEVAV